MNISRRPSDPAIIWPNLGSKGVKGLRLCNNEGTFCRFPEHVTQVFHTTPSKILRNPKSPHHQHPMNAKHGIQLVY